MHTGNTLYTRRKYYALVLAAGYSSRAGAFKMALSLAGKPVLHHVLDAIYRAAVHGVWVVTGHEARQVDDLVQTWNGASGFVQTVHNPIYAEGMLSSVLAGVRAIPEGAFLFILPGDYPLLTPEVFRKLQAAAEGCAENVFIPRHNGKNGHPVLLSPECVGDLCAWEGATLKEFLSGWNPAYIDVNDECVLIDLDTPEDRERIEELLKERRCACAENG